jgi:hypothetical protein
MLILVREEFRKSLTAKDMRSICRKILIKLRKWMRRRMLCGAVAGL